MEGKENEWERQSEGKHRDMESGNLRECVGRGWRVREKRESEGRRVLGGRERGREGREKTGEGGPLTYVRGG